jgi:hypothetical protein
MPPQQSHGLLDLLFQRKRLGAHLISLPAGAARARKASGGLGRDDPRPPVLEQFAGKMKPPPHGRRMDQYLAMMGVAGAAK